MKKFGDVGTVMKEAFAEYISEIQSGAFPDDEHSFKNNDTTDYAELAEKLND